MIRITLQNVHRMTEVELTPDEGQDFENGVGYTTRDGNEISLAAQTDETCVYTMDDDDGELLVFEGGCCYQSEWPWQNDYAMLLRKFGVSEVEDCYVGQHVVHLPSDEDEADSFIRTLDALISYHSEMWGIWDAWEHRPDDLITQTEAAELAGITPQAINNAIRDGRIHAYEKPDGIAHRPGDKLVSSADITARWKSA